MSCECLRMGRTVGNLKPHAHEHPCDDRVEGFETPHSRSRMHTTSRVRAVSALGVLPVLLILGACGGMGGRVDDPFADFGDRNLFRIYIQNDNYYDARVYAIAGGGLRQSLGFVGGKTDHVFTVPWSFSNELRIEINMVAGPTCVTEPIVVDPGDELRLQIMSAITTNDFCR